MKKRYDNKSTAKEYMEYIYDVSILGKWRIKVWMISRRIRSVYDYKVIKCNFIWKGRFKILVLLLSQRWRRRSGGIHMINSPLSPTTHPSHRKCQITSFASSDNVQILIAPSRDPDAKCIPSGKKQIELTLSIWPSNERQRLPVEASQIRTLLSSDPDRILFPSGEKQTDFTQRKWPVIGP